MYGTDMKVLPVQNTTHATYITQSSYKPTLNAILIFSYPKMNLFTVFDWSVIH